MPQKPSAGILLYRRRQIMEVLLVHPGGPFWAKRDHGAWSIAKGEYGPNEDPLAAARREFAEETGVEVDGEFIPLGSCIQKSGKQVTAWALEGDCDPCELHSNTFTMEWPPSSGKFRVYPEVDRAEWFDLGTAREKINPAQVVFIDELERHLS